MKVITVRVDREPVDMLAELSDKVGTAAQTVIHLFTYLRRETIMELRGRFSPLEIKAMAEVFKWFKPAWQIMFNSKAMVATIFNAEKHNSAISSQGADINTLVVKIEALTSAQSMICLLYTSPS